MNYCPQEMEINGKGLLLVQDWATTGSKNGTLPSWSPSSLLCWCLNLINPSGGIIITVIDLHTTLNAAVYCLFPPQLQQLNQTFLCWLKQTPSCIILPPFLCALGMIVLCLLPNGECHQVQAYSNQ